MTQKSNVNYGVQADSISAGIIGVGTHVRINAPSTPQERDFAIQQLTDAIRQLEIAGSQQKTLLENLNMLKTAPAPQHVSTIDKIVSGLKEAGHIAEVIAPLKGLAAAFGIPLGL